jgi:hypothetical protein
MMNDSTRVMRRPRRPRPPAARTAAAIIATGALALLATACGNSSSSTGSGGSSNTGNSTTSQVGINYASCMRSHGVPKYPDPSSSNKLANGLPKVSVQQLGVSTSQYQAAQNACAHLLPNGGQETQHQSQRDLDAMRAYAQCMRSHGVPTWPDPTYDPTAGWGFNLVNVHGFDPNSTQIDNKMDVCNRGLPPGIGVPLARPGHPG